MAASDGWAMKLMSRVPTLDPRLLCCTRDPRESERLLTDYLRACKANGSVPAALDAEAAVWLIGGAFGRMAMLRLHIDYGLSNHELAGRLVRQALGVSLPTLTDEEK